MPDTILLVALLVALIACAGGLGKASTQTDFPAALFITLLAIWVALGRSFGWGPHS